MSITDDFTYFGYSLGWRTVRKMPEKRAYRLFRRSADEVWKRHGKSVQQYEKNIRRVVPGASESEISELSRECMRSYATYWCDAFRMPDWPSRRIAELPVTGMEYMYEAMRTGSVPPVVVTPHAGNYDYGAAYFAQEFDGVTTVAEKLKPYKLFQRFVEFREARDVEVIAAGTPQIMDILANRVASGRVVGLVGERDLSRHGIPVQFFGEEARMPAGPAVLARRTGAEIIPVSFWYEGLQAHAEIFPAIPVPQGGDEKQVIAEVTQLWADQIAIGIERHPAHWHMLQPLWTADLDPARDPMRRRPRPDDAAGNSDPAGAGS